MADLFDLAPAPRPAHAPAAPAPVHPRAGERCPRPYRPVVKKGGHVLSHQCWVGKGDACFGSQDGHFYCSVHVPEGFFALRDADEAIKAAARPKPVF